MVPILSGAESMVAQWDEIVYPGRAFPKSPDGHAQAIVHLCHLENLVDLLLPNLAEGPGVEGALVRG